MTLSMRHTSVLLFFACICINTHAAVEEIDGASDFGGVGRVAGSVMIGFDTQEYGDSMFVEGDNGERKKISLNARLKAAYPVISMF